MRPGASISAQVASFLDFCRIEKGLAHATVDAYRLDLQRFAGFLRAGDRWSDTEVVRRYIDSLYRARMASRSISRHITTLRNLFRYLMEKGDLELDPTMNVTAPKHWQSLPKYLNKKQVNDLLAAPDQTKPQGLRDRAMLEFLYAAGLRVSELCKVRVSDVERNMGFVRVIGKGNKHRLVPVG